MPSTRSLILLFLTLLLWALATHKGAKVWVWWVVALAVALLVQGVFWMIVIVKWCWNPASPDDRGVEMGDWGERMEDDGAFF
ncbi:hypothetical protein D6C86_06036 [Aureobasidium pullulans]|uniref:Uncharacterized protein n=1 Tax=Aureobasidium pullulans TaxID=5580 RepID=A0A4S9V376_AURPU|nr:hypothetical protein D6C94_06579 [Aureobasidium pullulans]THZ45989.1 hypothetical protein D6C87_02470 [Aureobasidium pullulans]THZ59009.1 hypothetical protein D6C86_06036 [Aureobasidium pullulans]